MWTTGSVPQFADTPGVKGLLGTLLDWLAAAADQKEELVGTGTGAQTVFPLALTSFPIAKGQLRLTYKISGTWYEAWENGAGEFVGPQIASSTINRADGTGSVTFSAPVMNGEEVRALYSVGTTEGLDWLILQNRTSRDNSQNEVWPGELLQEVVLRNAGINYTDNVVVGMREFQYLTQQSWGWNLNGGKEYPRDYGEDWNGFSVWHGINVYNTTYELWSNHPSIYLKDDTMTYWFIANKRRIIVIVRVTNTVYASCYLGFGKRVSTEKENILPLIVCGNYVGAVNFSNTSLYGIAMPITSHPIIARPNGAYRQSQYNVKMGHDEDMPTTAIAKTPDDDIPIYPVSFGYDTGTYPDREYLFDYDGVFFSPNDELSVEDTLTIAAKDYLVVQDVYRVSFRDYFCVRLD